MDQNINFQPQAENRPQPEIEPTELPREFFPQAENETPSAAPAHTLSTQTPEAENSPLPQELKNSSPASAMSGIPDFAVSAPVAQLAGDLLRELHSAARQGHWEHFQHLENLAGELESLALDQEIENLQTADQPGPITPDLRQTDEDLTPEPAPARNPAPGREELVRQLESAARRYGEELPRLLPQALGLLEELESSPQPLALLLELARRGRQPETGPLYLEGSANFKSPRLSPDEEWFRRIQNAGGSHKILG